MLAGPDLSDLKLPELRALHQALGVAIAAAKAGGLGPFDCALLADDEGVSVTFTIPVAQATDTPTTNPQP